MRTSLQEHQQLQQQLPAVIKSLFKKERKDNFGIPLSFKLLLLKALT
jgi:hypothetical protein